MTKEIKTMQKGGVLLEAMAVLGLMTVATPLVYKKAIEKSKEIEDITVASQMRTVRDAAATYIEKNYETVHDGDTVTLTQLNQYLPPNFINNLSKSLVPVGTAPDDAMTVVIKKDSHLAESNALPVKRASAYVITKNPVGAGSIDEKRGNRIASLIGAEGGYVVDGNTVYGSNHSWEQDAASIQPGSGSTPITLQEGQIVAATTFTKDPLSGDFLYRNQVEGFPQFNMMMTNLDINGNSIEKVRSLGLKYNWQDDKNSIEFNGETGELVGINKNGKETVKMKNNDTSKGGSLELKSGSEDVNGCSRAYGNYDGSGAGGLSGCNSDGKETVALTASYLDDVGNRREAGKLSVRPAGDGNNAEAIGYGGYANEKHGMQGGAFELKDNDGASRTLLIGQEDESNTRSKKTGDKTYLYGFGTGSPLTEKDASKIQMYDKSENLKTYVGAVEQGARFVVGDSGYLGNTEDQTVFGDAQTASLTAKKGTLGFAQMTSRYSNEGYTEQSGAAVIANDASGDTFVLDKTKVTAVLAGNNNSGYLRLNSGNYAGKRVLMAATHTDGNLGGATYLYGSDGGTGNSVKMESNHNGANAGYMEFKSTAGGYSLVDGNYASTSAYMAKDNSGTERVKLLSNGGSSGGHLTLDQGKVIFAANDKTDFKSGATGPVMNLRTGTDSGSNKVAIAAVGNNNEPVASATSASGYANLYANNEDTSFGNTSKKTAAMLLSPDGSNNTIGAYADAEGKYGNTGTVSISNIGGGALNAHGFLDGQKQTVYNNEIAKDGGVVVASNTSGVGTAWLIGNSVNNAGMLSVGPDVNTKANRVDMYGAGKGTNGADMGGTAHMFAGSEGATIYANYQGYTPSASAIDNRNKYIGYAMTEIAGNATASAAASATDIYAHTGINASTGKLYTNVLCVNFGNNKNKTARGLIDNFAGYATVDGISSEIDAKGGKKCIPLPPNAKWKDIVYEAAGDLTKGELRGHTHDGFAEYGHEHPSYIPVSEELHHGSAKGKAKWNRVTSHYVGELCLTKASNYSYTSNHGKNSITCNDKCGGGCPNDVCATYGTKEVTDTSNCVKKVLGVCTEYGKKEVTDYSNCTSWKANGSCWCTNWSYVNGVHCCNQQSVYDQRESYWESVGCAGC